ncbi:lysine--tRNA ligase [Methylomagnum ishizawai]|uniref:lysine--tRNA ligase n=1 Tax=Methylomagnum ishizawai TaxID=1760988 RepID=UPI001C329715|nr:lysine--tRNA ligase [Methylomagnum ishizawai]BBL74014.1 lysine--tRNA ligase [Methylomagnum ishizawai]
MSNEEQLETQAAEANPEDNRLIAQRREKLAAIREQGVAFPNDFRRDALAQELHAKFGEETAENLEALALPAKLAGRLMAKRIMGKASFAHLQDMSGRIQIFLQRDGLPEGAYQEFKGWDLGDIVGVEGTLFKTKTGELSLKAHSVRLLSKSLRPLPEKFHGLTDNETRYRQRYVDLIMNEDSRRVFLLRSAIVRHIREFLAERGFLEVETPMMQVIPGGARAKPFITHHNALDMDLYLRIAPELYLKRLVVGGFEKVFEINRSFRNEGLSTKHNPEFTMIEFYQAYADYRDLMDLTEELLRGIAQSLVGTLEIPYQGETYDLSQPFRRMTVLESILHYNPEIKAEDLAERDSAVRIAQGLGIKIAAGDGLGKVQTEIFEKTVEDKLFEPTFITEYPAEVSPLARRNDENPFITDRFEFFVGGRELANGFSELNDAEDQAERFKRQVEDKDSGDEEAMHYDADYIRALEYGLPPTAGEGIGIDRLVMFFSDSPSIRDVILFPHMRREV